jgi:hypothetical protein
MPACGTLAGGALYQHWHVRAGERPCTGSARLNPVLKDRHRRLLVWTNE